MLLGLLFSELVMFTTLKIYELGVNADIKLIGLYFW